ncbi:hypothetical protein HanRHA438_Chr17g0815471 [Helianthus annuus]|nr:hypothetical protein HanIR_Chr17g0873871 [Helianthus annuus]KAJ0447726.1 hypothetical protein HanHA89_Chr17g0708601 [Helianthus annuus]KAJ0632623.1 hypothetical protein HanLR1_Chr17g0667201 [Helianthus annuus]KAJ0826542.1 hypothetical protein HanRHA438_Chr17g0815471 [Helianthus annuus]
MQSGSLPRKYTNFFFHEGRPPTQAKAWVRPWIWQQQSEYQPCVVGWACVWPFQVNRTKQTPHGPR